MQSHPLDRLVLDTNVIVSAVINNQLEEIVSLSAIHQIEIYTCQKQLAEIQQTLSKPKVKKYLAETPQIFIETFLLTAVVVEIDERFDRSTDPDDNFLFDLAYTVKSHYLVTREKELLNLKQVNKIKIISMAELRKMIVKKTA